MSPEEMKANNFRKLASQLQVDMNTIIELYNRVQEFADNIYREDVNYKNPNIYAVAMSLQHVYTALETAFKRVAKDVDGDLPAGENWHRELLEQMLLDIEGVRPRFISTDLKDKLDRLRRFRHIVRHGYDYELDWSQMQPLVESSKEILLQLEEDIRQFKSFLMEMANKMEN